MPLDRTPLANAIGRLCEGLRRHLAEPTAEQPRDGSTQRFEFTREVSHKTPRRSLREILLTAEDAGRITLGELGAPAENGACSAPNRRFGGIFATSAPERRTHDVDTAPGVLREIPFFREAARFLCGELEKRIG